MDNKLLFKKRNLERNVLVDINGIHNLYPSTLPNFFYVILRQILYIKEYCKFYIFKKLTIPQFEFILTTHCTLKCKKCAGYFPFLKNEEHFSLSFEEYKTQLDTLTNNVDEIKNLILTGGEPLTINDFAKICEYTLQNKKIKKVWVFTNCTIAITENLIEVIKKYNKKIIFKLSNYSQNENINKNLKTQKIIQTLNSLNCKYIYNKTEKWIDVIEAKDNNRNEFENRKYYRECLHTCVAALQGKIYACPRGGIITILKDLSNKFDCINLNKETSKKNIINFYYQDYFPYCNFCNFNQEKNMPYITPAEQID